MASVALRALAWLVLLTLLASCAFVDREVVFAYSAPPREAKAAVAAPVAPGESLWIGEVVDTRTETHRVGEIRNGFGMHTADVHAKGDARAWLRSALTTECERAGFVAAPSAAEAALVLDAQLVHVHVAAMFEYEGEVHVAVTVKRAGRSVLQASYVGKGDAGLNWTATDASLEETLDLAVQDAVLQLFADLRAGKAAAGAAVPGT